MEKVLILLSLFGCSDAVTQCDVLRVSERTYVSRQACERQIDAALQARLDAPYPTVVAHCGTAAETASLVDDLVPGADGAEMIAGNIGGSAPNS
jgi:hypothetical protein